MVGCATTITEESGDIPVRLGMSRDDLRFYFGEPLRIERTASGREDWYYRFGTRQPRVVGESGTVTEFDGQTTYATMEMNLAKGDDDRPLLPIHVSAEGYVIEPLPEGFVSRR